MTKIESRDGFRTDSGFVEVLDKTKIRKTDGTSLNLVDTEDMQSYAQPILVSGTNIKTVNSTSLLGSGNITISGGSLTVTEVDGSPSVSATTIKFPNGSLTDNGSGVCTVTLAGSGDMVLASAQTNTGAKTFRDATLLLRNVADTFSSQFTNTNTASRTYTLKDATGTIAFTSDITGTNSGTNTGDNSANSLYSGLVSNATHTGDATGATALTVVKINGTLLSGLATGILKNTTGTGVPSIAVAADFPTLNQSTTGSAATLTTPRAIYGNNFDGSAALTQIIASAYGGTGNGFTKFSGPTTAERTKTLRDATDTILELGGSYTPTGTWTSMVLVTPALGTPASGTLTNCTFPTGVKSKIFGVVFDGGGSTPTVATKRYWRAPWAGTITKVTLLADVSGAAVIDVWKDTYANYPPTVADTITASAKPTLSTAIKAEDSTLTGWTTSVSAGDVFGFNLDSVTTCTVLTLEIEMNVT